MLLLILSLIALAQAALARLASKRFQHWHWYDASFANIIHENCSVEYNNYLSKYDSGWHFGSPYYDTQEGPGQSWTWMDPLINCLLDHTNELGKANMASAAVLLGLMPTILAAAGSTLSETALLSARRPLLAFLLATGSPAVLPVRTFQHDDVPKMLVRRKSGLTIELSSTSQTLYLKMIVVCIELILALAATANVILTSYELGISTIISWSANG